jgi:hypothetical protein
MPETQATQFQRAKLAMRRHPDWSREQVLEETGIHKSLVRLVDEARRELINTENFEPFGPGETVS